MAPATRTRKTATDVPAPFEQVDLGRWLRGVTNEEYAGFTPNSRAHKSHTVVDTDPLAFEAVEYIGGTMLQHRYVAEVMEPKRVVCVSPTSRGRFLKAIPVQFRTTWTLAAEPQGSTTALTCRIDVEYRSRLWLVLSALSGSGFWLRLHNKEETPRMAESIAADARATA